MTDKLVHTPALAETFAEAEQLGPEAHRGDFRKRAGEILGGDHAEDPDGFGIAAVIGPEVDSAPETGTVRRRIRVRPLPGWPALTLGGGAKEAARPSGPSGLPGRQVRPRTWSMGRAVRSSQAALAKTRRCWGSRRKIGSPARCSTPPRRRRLLARETGMGPLIRSMTRHPGAQRGLAAGDVTKLGPNLQDRPPVSQSQGRRGMDETIGASRAKQSAGGVRQSRPSDRGC